MRGTLTMDEQGIEVYPVGFFADFKHKRVRNGIKNYLLPQVKRRNWRAVRNYFNGYLAEWHSSPEGVSHTKSGRGWTKRVALRRLGNHIVQSNLLVKGH